MIKIETMSADCVATINGTAVFTGQLFTSRGLATLQVLKGELMYTVDELEMVRITAKVPELTGGADAVSAKSSATNTSAKSTSAKSTSANSTSANSTSANSTSANSTSANSTGSNTAL